MISYYIWWRGNKSKTFILSTKSVNMNHMFLIMSTNWNSRGIILSIPQCFANQRWQLPWKSHSSDHEFYYAEKLKKSNTKKGIRCLITQIWNFYGYCGRCHSDCCSSSFWRGEKVFVFNFPTWAGRYI